MPLQRETVARAALDVVDEVGLDGLTMRPWPWTWIFRTSRCTGTLRISRN